MNKEVIRNFFVRDILYKNLKNLNETALELKDYFFSEHDFEVLLKRIESFRLGIQYMSPVTSNNVFLLVENDIQGFQSNDPEWYWNGYKYIKDIGQKASLDLIYNAEICIDDDFLYSYFVSLN